MASRIFVALKEKVKFFIDAETLFLNLKFVYHTNVINSYKCVAYPLGKILQQVLIETIFTIKTLIYIRGNLLEK